MKRILLRKTVKEFLWFYPHHKWNIILNEGSWKNNENNCSGKNINGVLLGKTVKEFFLILSTPQMKFYNKGGSWFLKMITQLMFWSQGGEGGKNLDIFDHEIKVRPLSDVWIIVECARIRVFRWKSRSLIFRQRENSRRETV